MIMKAICAFLKFHFAAKIFFYDNSESTETFLTNKIFKNVVFYQKKGFLKYFGIYSKPNRDFVQDANTLLLQSLSHKNTTE